MKKTGAGNISELGGCQLQGSFGMLQSGVAAYVWQLLREVKGRRSAAWTFPRTPGAINLFNFRLG